MADVYDCPICDERLARCQLHTGDYTCPNCSWCGPSAEAAHVLLVIDGDTVRAPVDPTPREVEVQAVPSSWTYADRLDDCMGCGWPTERCTCKPRERT